MSKIDDSDDFSDGSLNTLIQGVARAPEVAVTPRMSIVAGSELLGGRFVVRGRLGEGGMGTVFEAHDRVQNRRVALKTLTRVDPAGIYRLKNEFRLLADVVHDNLVGLHELFSDEHAWFFTMEKVDGVSFDEWVRPESALDERRLRQALTQLVAGVRAVHLAGRLHRDIKPSNVMVTAQGRVVILDFGLVSDPKAGGVGQTMADDSGAGTPIYMAPEQAGGRGATEASDWYAVGVMLYEALTNQLPFDGKPVEVLMAKRDSEAPSVQDLAPGAPRDLSHLCGRLLRMDPELRPGGSDLQELLGTPRQSMAPGAEGRSEERTELVGRHVELDILRDAHERAADGKPAVVLLSGESGMGKSALVETFLGELGAERRTVVLSGRCYERESVPFKAFDPLVDELTRYLRKLPEREVGMLMPREVFALARLFPVLERIGAVAGAPARLIPDAQELRRRAFRAFGELLAAIRDRNPLVIHVDDLQWGDSDSAAFIRYLVELAEPVPLLFVAGFRSEQADRNPVLKEIRRAVHSNPSIDARELELKALTRSSATQLAERLLEDGAATKQAAAIARESEGNPFFVGELCKHVNSAKQLTGLSLREALLSRVGQLGEAPQKLLRTVVLAARPLSAEVLAEAAEVGDDAARALDVLRVAQLARPAGGETQRLVEPYHDRIREAVASALDDSVRRAIHGRLAQALSGRPDADPEVLSVHYEGAGDEARAAECSVLAAERAAMALAFDRAARLYESALQRGNFDAHKARELRIAMGDALVQAGRGKEAGDAFIAAADGADEKLRAEMQVRAAEQLMLSGFVEAGLDLVHGLLERIGMAPSKSTMGTGAAWAYQKTALKLRGTKFSPASGGVDPEELRKLDICWSCARVFCMTDVLQGAVYTARHLRLALELRESTRVGRGLALESPLSAFVSVKEESRVRAMMKQAHAISNESEDPYLQSVTMLLTGNALMFLGDLPEAREKLATSIALLREHCTGVAWEVSTADMFHATTCSYLGELAQLSVDVPRTLIEAERRGDLYGLGILQWPDVSLAWLVPGNVDEAKARLHDISSVWPTRGFGFQELAFLYTSIHLALYEGEPERAWQALKDAERFTKGSLLFTTALFRSYQDYYTGVVAAFSARGGGSLKRDRMALANKSAKRLGKTPSFLAPRFAPGVQAAIACSQGNQELAVKHLEQTSRMAKQGRMKIRSAAADLRRGQIMGGDEGEALVREALARMRAEQIADPERMAEVLMPGCTL